MKRIILMLSLILSATLLCISCGAENNPVAPISLVGDWNLVTFTAQQEGFTLTAGQETDMGDGVTMTITGTYILL